MRICEKGFNTKVVDHFIAFALCSTTIFHKTFCLLGNRDKPLLTLKNSINIVHFLFPTSHRTQIFFLFFFVILSSYYDFVCFKKLSTLAWNINIIYQFLPKCKDGSRKLMNKQQERRKSIRPSVVEWLRGNQGQQNITCWLRNIGCLYRACHFP